MVPKVVPNAALRDSNYLQVVDYTKFFVKLWRTGRPTHLCFILSLAVHR